MNSIVLLEKFLFSQNKEDFLKSLHPSSDQYRYFQLLLDLKNKDSIDL